jgi:hypothetical protein
MFSGYEAVNAKAHVQVLLKIRSARKQTGTWCHIIMRIVCNTQHGFPLSEWISTTLRTNQIAFHYLICVPDTHSSQTAHVLLRCESEEVGDVSPALWILAKCNDYVETVPAGCSVVICPPLHFIKATDCTMNGAGSMIAVMSQVRRTCTWEALRNSAPEETITCAAMRSRAYDTCR